MLSLKTLPVKAFALALVVVSAMGCHDNNPRHRVNKRPISFKSIEGITYTEVARFMQNGLSFNEYGYHLSPDWRMRFVSKDSVALFSPVKKQFLNFPLACGLDSIINTNRSYLKMRRMSKDSLVFELLLAHEDTLDVTGAKIFMKFYADDYIKNKLHTTAEVLQRYRRRDTLFVKGLVEKANADMKEAFAAQHPVQFVSKSPILTVQKRKTAPGPLFENSTVSDDYMDPHYDIVIKKAYADFKYSFSVYVDKDGNMYYDKPLFPFTDGKYRDNYIHNSTAILNGYLKKYLADVPGQSLGMKHASLISLHVKGIAKDHTVAAR
ncbi:hypothetical protein [Mucilaginibacter pedocola]|uniref:DUF4296 domain-containing protein n=1 Tax=Mucilaginibacter pedocola TaxID=1792845 RepID=A0A1S9PCG9_9SPHI|nr:hypothetical protein [Mucilaginibacter pedocola]OOQ58629.1 hypothetical protein BC343_08160 [Mucilaginibacter pedocola]